MALYPVYVFEVDTFHLKDVLVEGQFPDEDFDNIQTQRELITVSFRGLNGPKKHGDQFTVGGPLGTYLYDNFSNVDQPTLTVISKDGVAV